MDRRNDINDLSGLLDGELDDRQAELLFNALKEDETMKEEFELQRDVKTALSQLPEYDTPDFLATRVMGEISLRRNEKNEKKVWHWRTVAAAFGGFAAALLLFVGVTQFGSMTPSYTPKNPTIALDPASRTERVLDGPRAIPVANLDSLGSWEYVKLPEEVDDEATRFLNFASEAHGFSSLENETEEFAPDMKTIIRVLEGDEYVFYVIEGGGQ